ncbi:MAG TPA: hypothetical protein DCP90_01750 [Clostridiales bacterium]|nr:MAG: hypothetical protein A2Y22_03440 [Clostridiales bacterium GWD2_32_59]HAN09318.1 hypothetical protein [Clostridiales bacterium]
MEIEKVVKIFNGNEMVNVYYGEEKVWIEDVDESKDIAIVRHLEDDMMENVKVSELRGEV